MWWFVIGLLSVFVFRVYESEPISIIWYPIGICCGILSAIAVFLWILLDIKI